MSKLKNILKDLQNQDEETISLLSDISNFVESQRDIENENILKDVECTVKEELIHSYMVLYEYKLKKIMQKDKNGTNVEQIFSFVRIISITEPLSHKIVQDQSLFSLISNILDKKISNSI